MSWCLGGYVIFAVSDKLLTDKAGMPKLVVSLPRHPARSGKTSCKATEFDSWAITD